MQQPLQEAGGPTCSPNPPWGMDTSEYPGMSLHGWDPSIQLPN